VSLESATAAGVVGAARWSGERLQVCPWTGSTAQETEQRSKWRAEKL
jgi:hypothetical protein